MIRMKCKQINAARCIRRKRDNPASLGKLRGNMQFAEITFLN